jgi:hypothetical protein
MNQLKIDILGISLLNKLNTTGATNSEIQHRIYELELENKLEYYFKKKNVIIQDVLQFFNFIQGVRNVKDHLCIICQTDINKDVNKVLLFCTHWCHKECLLLDKNVTSCTICNTKIDEQIRYSLNETGTILERIKNKRKRENENENEEEDEIETQLRKKLKINK